MRHITSWLQTVLLAAVTVSVVVGLVVFYGTDANRREPAQTTTTQSVDNEQPLTPQRLQIPALGVDAAVEPVGVNEVGNMAAPSDWRDVSWYQPGFVPGQEGNAVFAGHRDWDGEMAVFGNLRELTSGDVVRVTGADGHKLTYTVVESKEYDYQTADTTSIFGSSSVPQLKLITCDGEFIEASDTYQKRLVVTARLTATTTSATTTNPKN